MGDLATDIGDSLVALLASHDQLVAAVRERHVPRPLPLSAAAVADANGNAVLAFDACSQGETWDLRRLVVGGATWGTAAAGTAVAYKTTGFALSAPALTDVVDQAPALPNVAFYLDGQVTLTGGEKLVVAVEGGTPGQQYLASAHFTRD